MELNDLPDELLLQIFFHLSLGPITDIFYLTLICKKWYQILRSKEFLQQINSFKYQSRFIIYHCFLKNNRKQNNLHQFLEYDSYSTKPYLTINGDLTRLKQDIENCPLTNMTISMWCRTLSHSSLHNSTILLLWHFHLGYVGFYRDDPNQGYALVKCTYAQQHQLKTKFRLEIDEWYHIAIVIKEKNLQLYINGNRIGNWLLEENINKQNVSIAPHSSIWFASHCGPNRWLGSLFDICLWKRCLESYELKEIAQIRKPIETINFIPYLKL